MTTLSFKETKMIPLSPEKKREVMDMMKNKSISYEHLEQKEKTKLIKNEFKIFAASHKLHIEEDPERMLIDLYGAKIFYPDMTGKLEGIVHCNDVQYTALRELLLRLSKIVELKIKDDGKPMTFSSGKEFN